MCICVLIKTTPLSSLYFLPIPELFFPPTPCALFKKLLSPLSAACMCLGEGPSDKGWEASQEPQPWRKVTFPFPSSRQFPVVPWEFI